MKPHGPDPQKAALSGKLAQSVRARELGELTGVRPMDAVTALYSEGEPKLSEAIIASLSDVIFAGGHPGPAGPAQQAFARLSYRVLKWTTSRLRAADGAHGTGDFHNPILVWSGHPYARALLNSSTKETESLVEGGDPMNGPYMMISPEILKSSDGWDRAFLHSVQGRDVQLRFMWETQATYESAQARLKKGEAVRLKAVAAGTGLSMILAYDRLIKDGHDPEQITVRITDRDRSNMEKTRRLLAKLASTRAKLTDSEKEGSISAGAEDLFEGEPGADTTGGTNYHVVTAVGILDYLQGFTCDTTERALRLEHPEEVVKAEHLAAKLGHMTAPAGDLIVNTYRPHASTRILELFGRRFDYRHKEDLTELLATAVFRAPRLVGAGNMYDVLVYEKIPA